MAEAEKRMLKRPENQHQSLTTLLSRSLKAAKREKLVKTACKPLT